MTSATMPEPSGAPAALERSPVPGISRNVFVLGLVSLCTDVSSEMVYPLIPIFLTSVLAAPASVVGLVEGVAEATASLLRVFFGLFSDRLGRRKPFVYAGYGLSACSKPLIALASVWPLVLFARFADRFGKGVRTPARDALIAESSRPETRGRAFGFHRSLDTLGAVFGPLLAFAALGALGGDLRIVFVLAFIPGIASLFLVRLARETGQGSAAKSAASRPHFTPSRGFLIFVGVSMLFALGNSSDAFLVLRAGNLGLGTQQVVLAYMLFNATYALLSTPAGIISDRLGRRDVIAVGMLIFAVVYSGFGLASSSLYVWGLFAVYGAYMAMTEGVGKALISDFAPAETRATALGFYYTAMGAMALLSSLLAGQLWDRVGPSAPFLLGGVTATLAAILLLLLLPRMNHVQR
ncbi:MAG: MFS transporter [Bacteroidetes bacterium]|nr:MFS transporter [Bacteroidota bacterium]